MNWDIIEGDWTQFKGHVKEKWGKLTDDQLDEIAGKRERLAPGAVRHLEGSGRGAGQGLRGAAQGLRAESFGMTRQEPVRSILDPSFRYTASFDTDVRKTFARIRRERDKQAAHALQASSEARIKVSSIVGKIVAAR